MEHNAPVTVVFVTGGLGSGKSTFTQLCAKHGAQVLDADQIVNDLYKKDKDMVSQLAEILGPSILSETGEVIKGEIAAKVFNDAGLLDKVEKVIHPKVRKVLEKTAISAKLLVYEIPVLNVETDLNIADFVVVVTAPAETRLSRAIARGMSREDALARMERQKANQYIPPNAVIVENSGDISDLECAVIDFLGRVSND
jgi:dephospho-CoA kinase